MKKKLAGVALVIGLWLALPVVNAQTITKQDPSPVSGSVCPATFTYYQVSVPSNLSTCTITWSATNGTVTVDNSDSRKAKVQWNDTPGASGTVTANFTSCTNGAGNTSATKTELILSVKNQAWGSYGTSINLDYCTKAPVHIMVPRMFVQGTGGVAQPPLTEVTYFWTIPSGWREVSTNRTGSFGTTVQFIDIEPIKCSTPGLVTVQGVLQGIFCSSAAPSATATISLNGANPVVTVGPQSGYTGSTACNTTPVNFYATTSVALGCISAYTWSYPSSWQFVSQSGNSITLQPTGNASDADPAGIKATVSFSCGSAITSAAYVVPFNAPQISAPPIICSTGATVTVTNVSTSAQINWTVSSNLTIVSGQGTRTLTVKSPNTTIRGDATISAVLASCPTVPVPSKAVWVGKPSFVTPITGPAQLLVDYSGQYHVNNAKGATNAYSWTMEPDWYIYTSGPGGNQQSATIVAKSPTIKKLTINTSNICGTESSWKYIEGMSSCNVSISAYPNPSRGGDITINIIPPPGGCDPAPQVASSALTNLSGTILLRNSFGEKVIEKSFGEKGVELQGMKLKPGLYFIKVNYKGKTFEERLVVE